MTINGYVTIETWLYYNELMPTGFLTNAKLSIPHEVPVQSGLCAPGPNPDPRSPPCTPNAGWAQKDLLDLQSTCGSYTGTYAVAKTPADLCAASGFSADAADAVCAPFSAGPRRDACLTDVCGLASPAMAGMHAVVNAELDRAAVA